MQDAQLAERRLQQPLLKFAGGDWTACAAVGVGAKQMENAEVALYVSGHGAYALSHTGACRAGCVLVSQGCALKAVQRASRAASTPGLRSQFSSPALCQRCVTHVRLSELAGVPLLVLTAGGGAPWLRQWHFWGDRHRHCARSQQHHFQSSLLLSVRGA